MDKKSLAIKTLADWASRGAALSATQRQAIRQPRLLDQIGSPVTIDEDLEGEESFIEAELKEGLADDRHHLTLEEYALGTPVAWVVEWAGRDIEQGDWKPADVRDDNKDPLFREFILSHIPRFDKIGYYKQFYLYLEQARRWHNETKDIEVTDLDDSEAYTFVRKEYRRMQQNKLYALNRYVRIKDDQYPEGRPYWAGVPQALLCFLMDRGNNIVLLKGRQAAITSTMMAIAVIEMLMRNNYSSVLLTDDKLKTGIDILSKKVQATFQLLPEWIRQNVVDALWAKEYVELDFEHAGSKMEKRRNSSGLNLISADDTQAVNSKTPTHTFYDEVQNIPTYGIIKREVKPTQLSRMPDGTIKMVRQQAAWGCVCAGTKVWTNSGDLINIEDLKPEMGILGYDGKGVSKENITYWQPPADKECYRVTTNTGRFLECSDDHPVLWGHPLFRSMRRINGHKTQIKEARFVEAQHIVPGDHVAVIGEVPIFGEKKMWEPRLIGWLIGDGYYGGSSVRLSNCDAEINRYVYDNFEAKTEKEYMTKDGRHYKETRINGIGQRLVDVGIRHQTKLDKRLPVGIQSYCKEDICEVLGGLFDTDGSVIYTEGKHCRCVNLTASGYELLNEVRMLLQKLGIHSNITRVKANPETNPRDKNDWYVLTVSRSHAVKVFYEKIRFFIGYKQERLASVAMWHRMKVENFSKKRGIKPEGIEFERVVKVEKIGMKPVYNLTAGNTHTYIANGIVTHNTGASHDKGKGVFEKDWRDTFKGVEDGVPTGGWVALFFDWTCRPGFTSDDYMKQKQEDLHNSEHDGETALAIFNAHYPSHPDDAFMKVHNGVVPAIVIKRNRDNLLKMPDSIRPVLGNFRPVYDLSRPITALNADHRYYIKGSEFVEAKTSAEMLSAKVKMFMPPDNEYINRFFQGTDPIQSSTGLSNFASAVWDAYGMEAAGCCGAADKHLHPTVACILNGRTHDPKEMFTQSVLMGMHYRNYGERACRELVEWNQGQSYVEYKQQEWVDQGRSLLMRAELPERFNRNKSTGNPIGFTSSTETKGLLLGELESMVYTFGHNIKYLDFWSQLQEIEVEDKDGKKMWGTRDYKTFKDDLVIATVLAKLCRDSIRESPMKVGTEAAPLTRTRYTYQRVATPLGHRLVQVPEVYTVKY